MNPTISAVGKPINRVDGILKVTGRARYAAEAQVPNVAHAVILQSTIGHGRTDAIDTSAAKQSPGVLEVITWENMPKLQILKKDFATGSIPAENRTPLSDNKVHYFGQHIAVVIADTIEQARHAATLIKVQYALEPVVIDINDPKAKQSDPKESFGEPAQVSRGEKVDSFFKRDDLTILDQTYSTPTETHNPMEMSATTAVWDGDRVTIHDSTQYVMGVRAYISDSMSLPRENVRVLCPYTGGGFGCKGFQWPHEILTAVAARMVNRPVKLMLTRKQMFTSCGHRPPTIQKMTLAADKTGKLQALRHDSTMHGSFTGEHVEACGIATSKLLYAVDNLDIQHHVRQVNVNTPTPMRAPGECPGTYALESAMDELANQLKIDPVQLRLINYADVHPETKKPWSSKHLKECYELGAAQFGWASRNAEPRSTRTADGKLLGWGMATATYPGYRFGAIVRIRLICDGNDVRALASCATHDLGTGAWTVFTQATADALGLPIERVKFDLGDTSLPYGPVAGGSNSTASVTQAIFDAANLLKKNLLNVPTDRETPLSGIDPGKMTFRDSSLMVADDVSRSMTLRELLGDRPSVEATTPPPQGPQQKKTNPKTEDTEEDYGANQQKYAFQSFGAHFVEVQVDERLARVRVTRVVSAMDVGRILNPKTARSQVIGGVIMGIGMALMEGTEYDHRSGAPINSNLADYPVCVNADIRSIETYFVDHPDLKMNPLGCRGVGEIGITGIAAAVANAVYHATGKRVRDLPITPDKLI